MATRHRPVLLGEVLDLLDPREGSRIVDLTLGGGGYSAALLERGASIIALDRDPEAIERCKRRLAVHGERFQPHQRDFGSFARLLDESGWSSVDGICMDLGLSSDQLDDATRGFGFRHDGPLDLRFDGASGEPASALLSRLDADDLQRLLSEFGEVRHARGIARRLSERASATAELSTADVREVVVSVLPKRVRPEPELARVFQALRIAVNGELEQLEHALADVPNQLRAGGRFVCVSYHSLEDRRVKSFLRRESGRIQRGNRHAPQWAEAPQARMRELTRRPLRPTPEEIAANPRARSARLRAGERLS